VNISGEGKNRLVVTTDGPEAHALGRLDLPVRVRFTDFYRRGFSGLYNPGEVATITAGEAAVLVANGRAELVP
jgi:hypothetical protein